ncbi:hypothetical protein AB833_22600 [Chromatiales bacterium (ex Bugula neritina AB1)]|nr:hypothetical protein AB833_22600 [Chromatiales bacterium (ex Bugula neritina AB1)]
MISVDTSYFRWLLLAVTAFCSACSFVAVEQPESDQSSAEAVQPPGPEVHTILASAGPFSVSEKPGCRGPGFAECEANWKQVQPGWSQQQVIETLGAPAAQSEPLIFIHQVTQQWSYEEGEIEFNNEQVSGIVESSAYDFIEVTNELSPEQHTEG